MADSMTLTCPSCGGKLQVADTADRVTCPHCGAEQLIKKEAGIIQITSLAEGMTRVQEATAKTASELAIKRLDKELSEMASHRDEINQKYQVEMESIQAAYDTLQVQYQGSAPVPEASLQQALRYLLAMVICLVAAYLYDSSLVNLQGEGKDPLMVTFTKGGGVFFGMSFVVILVILIFHGIKIIRQIPHNQRQRKLLESQLAEAEIEGAKRMEALKAHWKSELTRLDQELNRKRDELQKHERIVRG